jgi:hypothetical protein
MRKKSPDYRWIGFALFLLLLLIAVLVLVALLLHTFPIQPTDLLHEVPR